MQTFFLKNGRFKGRPIYVTYVPTTAPMAHCFAGDAFESSSRARSSQSFSLFFLTIFRRSAISRTSLATAAIHKEVHKKLRKDFARNNRREASVYNLLVYF